MRQMFFAIVALLLGFSFVANAQMKLKLQPEFSQEQNSTLGNHDIESNLKLDIPPEATSQVSNEFLKMWFVGVLADASFPLGDFGDAWSTGFSGHVMLGYMVARSILLNLSVGYVSFSEKELIAGQDKSFSWIPILVGLNYIFNQEQKFMPFIGLALGLYFWHSSYSFTVNNQTYDGSDNNSYFGIAPRVGAYYLVSAAVLLTFSAQYDLLFTEGDSTTSLAVLVGAMFALH